MKMDLTGETYGRLLVLKEAPTKVSTRGNKSRMWLCKCECGKETTVSQSGLRTGHTKSCGCLRNNPNRTYEYKVNYKNGDAIGSSTVLRLLPVTRNGKGFKDRRMSMLCECGNVFECSVYNANLDRVNKCRLCSGEDLTGETFGEWTVLKEAERRVFKDNRLERAWYVKCSCGVEKSVMQASLKCGGSTSCGCLSISKGEKKIVDWLEDREIDFEREYVFDDCRNELPLPFDFAIFNHNNQPLILLEFDGGQHYNLTSFPNKEERLKRTRINDNIKTTYCRANDIPLIRIPYWEFHNIDSILFSELYKLDKEEVK